MAKKHDPDAFHTESGFLVRFIEKRRVDAIKRNLDALPTDRVLEVGCGAGNIIEGIDARIVGVDLSSHLLSKAKKRLPSGTVELVRADGEAVPFQDHSFDRVICSEVLEHVLHPENVIAEIARLLKPGGTAVITIPNEAKIDMAKRLMSKLRLNRILPGMRYNMPGAGENEWHLHHYDLKIAKEQLSPYLRILKIQPIPVRLMPLHYVIKCSQRTCH
ncbi:MAG: class I SAM-dependent methyltransferase [Dehalococcoidia bacterium]|nr:class I SAM-dependent methyltransferase [Dehalococcoidia bacterium]